MNGMENLRFDENGYFYVLVFYCGLFYKKNRKHFFPAFPYIIETLVKVWENYKPSVVRRHWWDTCQMEYRKLVYCRYSTACGHAASSLPFPLGTSETDTLLKMGFQTFIFCSKVPSKCRKCRFRDPNFKIWFEKSEEIVVSYWERIK